MSPARLLAASLTDPETRGEWERGKSDFLSMGHSTTYVNKSRDLQITEWWSTYSGGVTTPFTLTKAEQKLVREALDTFNKHHRMCGEAEALNRLTAKPKSRAKARGEQ